MEKNTVKTVRAERTRGVLQPPVSGLEREPDRAHEQGESHHAGRERSTRPAERKNDAEMLVQKSADRSAASEQKQQNISGHHWRKH